MSYRADKIVPTGAEVVRRESQYFTIQPERDIVVIRTPYSDFIELSPEVAEHVAALLTDAAVTARNYRKSARDWRAEE